MFQPYIEDVSSTRILIVEDESLIANSIEETLVDLGYQVCGLTAKGEDAVNLAEKLRPHLVLMDIILKGEMDGDRAAELIFRTYNIPVVYLTAYADPTSLKRTSMTLPYGYLTKPFKSRDLDIAIRMALLRHNVEDRIRAGEEKQKELVEKIRNLSGHIQSVREEERAYVAREVHDELGQSLTALKMDLSWLLKRMDPSLSELREKTNEMLGLTDSIIQTVKKISSELRPGLLDDLGLTAAIEWQSQVFQERTGINCRLDLIEEDFELDQERATAVFRIFQETLTNITRHARASMVDIKMKKTADELSLFVKDNGVGITQKQINDPRSMGLLGIKERMAYFKGRVTISGGKRKGTAVFIRMPLTG